MKRFECSACGANDLYEENGYAICKYCGTKFKKTREDGFIEDSSIELDNDVKRLIEKIEKEPQNAKKYAQLILTLDPHNDYAARILKQIEAQNTGCYIATAVYGSYDCPELWTLRRFRDDVLSKTWFGRAFIRVYYAISPSLVKRFGHLTWFRDMGKNALDRLVNKLQNKGIENTPYQDKTW